MPLLQLDQATIHFGGLCAVNAVDLVLGEGELVGLIGPNGAGIFFWDAEVGEGRGEG